MDAEERAERFRPREDVAAVRLAELKEQYARKREAYVAQGTKLVGTCTDMCPEYERVEREVQKELDRFEVVPGTQQADARLAVKIYRRPAAGRELPLPEEVRPPAVLQRTLDYLVHQLVPREPSDPHFAAAQPFLWNRTRAIRQDFIVQSESGAIAIACHERIARYHILCLHWKGGVGAEAWSEQQELEQLRKTLRSLMEYYDDARAIGHTYDTEPEFRAYNLLLHVRDPEALREVELLPAPVFLAPPLQWALTFRTMIQRSNLLEKRGQPSNTEATPNFFTRALDAVRRPDVGYLMACLAENLFPTVRIGAVKALARAYLPQHHGLPLTYLTRILGMDTDDDTTDFLRTLNVEVDRDVAKINRALVLDEDKSMPSPFSRTIVEAKRGQSTCQDIIDARQTASPSAAAIPPVPRPAPRLASPPMARPAPAPAATTASKPKPFLAPSSAPPLAPPPAAHLVPPLMAPKKAPPVPPAEPSAPAAPPAPTRRIPRDRWTAQLAALAVHEVVQTSVHNAVHAAMRAEHGRRRKERRHALLNALTRRVYQRLVAEPVATCTRVAAMQGIATARHERTMQTRIWTHWRAVHAKVQDRHTQAERLKYLRARLRPRIVSPHTPVHQRAHAPRLSDTERQAAFVEAQATSSRLWEHGSMARALIEHVAAQSSDTPGMWTAAIYLSTGAGDRWLRHKLALDTQTRLVHTLPQGTTVQLLDASVYPVQDAQLALVHGQHDVGTASAVLAIVWHASEARDLPYPALVLDDPRADPDALFRHALDTLVPPIHAVAERTESRSAWEPLWNVWLETSDACDAMHVQDAYEEMNVLTTLANAFLRTVGAPRTIPPPEQRSAPADVLALSQLEALPWHDESVALLRAHVVERAQRHAFRPGAFMQSLLTLALEGAEYAPDASVVPEYRQLCMQLLTGLQPAPPPPMLPPKRPCTPPAHTPKRIRSAEDASMRLRRAVAQSAQLLAAPLEK